MSRRAADVILLLLLLGSLRFALVNCLSRGVQLHLGCEGETEISEMTVVGRSEESAREAAVEVWHGSESHASEGRLGSVRSFTGIQCSGHLSTRAARALTSLIIILMYIYHALINALSARTIHINLNTIFYTHVEHSPTKTIYIKYY